MQRVNEHTYYELGMKIHPLTTFIESDTIKERFWHMWEAREAIESILRWIPLKICRNSASNIVAHVNSVLPPDWQQSSALVNSDETLKFHAFFIRNAANEFETVLAAELQTLDTYFVSQKGTYSTPDLIERAEIIFPESIRRHLPDSAIADIRQAGRSLALDSPTACGFHILRAIEAVMAQYYALVVEKPIPTRMRNWGIYIKKLRSTPGASKAIIEFLDHIRDQYRNPITHPDVMLELDEVEVLLGVAVASIRQMIIEIQGIKERAAVDQVKQLPSGATIQSLTQAR